MLVLQPELPTSLEVHVRIHQVLKERGGLKVTTDHIFQLRRLFVQLLKFGLVPKKCTQIKNQVTIANKFKTKG
jgi:hypothetical protein